MFYAGNLLIIVYMFNASNLLKFVNQNIVKTRFTYENIEIPNDELRVSYGRLPFLFD